MKKKSIIVGVIIATTVVVLGSYTLFKRLTDTTMAFHCNNINKDFTRPPERMCVTPLSIDNNNFTFKTENNNVETYAIIPLSGGVFDIDNGENDFYYIFLNY